MKKRRQRRGSVLMEFIIVFPIYLILFAGTVAIGDMLIHSNRLVSADRVAAFRVDGHERAGFALSRWSGWDLIAGLGGNRDTVFHPGHEIADDGIDQDALRDVSTGHYADVSGPWTVCSAATVRNDYRPLAGGTLGQLLAANMLVGGGWRMPSIVNMVSKDTRNGASFYVLKRRDHYWQRLIRREGENKYIRSDSDNWRDRNHVSRLLRTQGGPGKENWRIEVADENWHTGDTVSGRSVCTSCSEAYGVDIPGYSRYSAFVSLSY